MVTIGMMVERMLPMNRKMTAMTIDRRRDQSLGDFADRGADELGRVVGDRRVEAGGQPRLDAGNHAADAVDHGQRVGLGRAVDADEHRLQPVEGRGGIGILRPELDLGDVAEAHQPVAVRGDHQLAERLGGVERGQRVDADLGVVALHLAGGGDEIVGRERVRTSLAVTPRAAIRVGSSQMRMAKVWPPRIWALATPSTVCNCGCTTRMR